MPDNGTEPEDAGVVDAAVVLKRCKGLAQDHDETTLLNALDTALTELEAEHARAERLETENADWGRRCTDLLDDVTGKNLELDRLRAALREIEGRVSEKEDNRWTWFSQYDSELRDIASAALAGDAPGCEEAGIAASLADTIRQEHVRRPFVPDRVSRETLNAELRLVADKGYCEGCSREWPCPTIVGLWRSRGCCTSCGRRWEGETTCPACGVAQGRAEEGR